MKKRTDIEQVNRNKRIYHLYKRGCYTYRGLANLFRLSAPRVVAIVKKIEEQEKAKQV